MNIEQSHWLGIGTYSVIYTGTSHSYASQAAVTYRSDTHSRQITDSPVIIEYRRMEDIRRKVGNSNLGLAPSWAAVTSQKIYIHFPTNEVISFFFFLVSHYIAPDNLELGIQMRVPLN